MINEFLKAVNKYDTYTENGAIANSTTGSILADQFSKSGSHRGRSIDTVFTEQGALWGENPLMALRFPFYLRTITRKCKLYDDIETEKVQKGQGNRDESFKRLLWIAKYHPESFYKNLWLLPILGSWKDLWSLMAMDNFGAIDNEKVFEVIKAGIDDDYQIDLIKKFLPRIRNKVLSKSEWANKSNKLAKDFCSYMGWTNKQYRLFKSSGKAHIFQKEMCAKRYNSINFNTIPGKALFLMTKETGKNGESFIKRHGLEKKYISWLSKQPVAKFTGYPYELAKSLYNLFNKDRLSLAHKMTIDKQFDGLLEKAKQDNGGIKGNVWCALDTSGSMSSKIGNSDLRAYTVCIALGIYFSSLNEGAFKDNVIMFDNTSRVKKLSGTFTDKYFQIVESSIAWGSTNFLSVIDEIVRVRKTNPKIPVSDYPNTLLVVSDMQFNPSGSERSNFDEAKARLREVFPDSFVDNFRVIWWDCIGRVTTNQPSSIDDSGTYVFSGFDGSIITLLLGGETKADENGEKVKLSMMESINQALSQEVLEQINL